MAIRTFRQDLLIDDHLLVSDDARLCVTFVTRNVRVSSLQWEMCSRIVIENGGNPAL